MDRELEEQIDELIQKNSKDLKTKILRIVLRTQNKLLKEQARELKGGGTTVRKPVASSVGTRKSSTKESSNKKSSSTKKDRGESDSESDRYYSS